MLANALADGLPADGVITGTATHRRPAGLPDGQRLHGQGRLLGRPYRREDHPDHRAGVRDRRPDGLPGRLGRRPDHRPGRPVPRPPRRRARSSTTRYARPARSRRSARCSARARPAGRTSRRSATWSRWSTATPACTSAPTGWSRWSPARRPRWRRWAGPGCTAPSPAVGHFLVQDRGRGARRRPPLPVLPAVQLDRSTPPAAQARRTEHGRPRGAGAGQRAAGLRHAAVRQGPARRGLVLRDPARCGRAS